MKTLEKKTLTNLFLWFAIREEIKETILQWRRVFPFFSSLIKIKCI
jgi:hypothetical protein